MRPAPGRIRCLSVAPDASTGWEQRESGVGEYNFQTFDLWTRDADGRFVSWAAQAGNQQRELADWAATTGTDWATYTQEAPGMSAFALEDGVVYHTYSAYARGLDGLWGMYQWLDRAPRARNEERAPDAPLNWFRRHDEYESE
jgi:predicted dithiol-disulfide oxidoreductase (DUF899 family)